MSCPGGMLVFGQGIKSYKDLPLYLAEFGKVNRYEAAGALAGLMRVREFTQDDAHIFCTEDQLESEVVKLQDPDHMARYAREKFGYTKDGELILRVENKDKSSSSSDSTEENVIKEDN